MSEENAAGDTLPLTPEPPTADQAAAIEAHLKRVGPHGATYLARSAAARTDPYPRSADEIRAISAMDYASALSFDGFHRQSPEQAANDLHARSLAKRAESADDYRAKAAAERYYHTDGWEDRAAAHDKAAADADEATANAAYWKTLDDALISTEREYYDARDPAATAAHEVASFKARANAARTVADRRLWLGKAHDAEQRLSAALAASG